VYIADIMIMVSKDKAVRRRILDEDYENYARADVPAMIESFLSYYDTDFEAQAAHITADTDRIAPVASVTALAAAIPSATLRVLPGAGHLLPMEAPADVVEPLTAFLRGTVAEPTESV
jgi:pimeloyl-ACP methyl ester carboxylesterase